jgi:hypothetical protein
MQTPAAYRVERDAKPPNTPRNLTAAWDKLTALEEAPPQVRDVVAHFAESKRITLEALEQLETRVKVGNGGAVTLAFPRYVLAPTDEFIVCAIRYRPLDPDRPRTCEKGSALAPPVLPQTIGDTDSSEWFVCEGETDGARLWLLTEGEAAIVVLGGTRHATFSAWDLLYPPEATVYVALDADRRKRGEPASVFRGEEASELLLQRLGGRAVRLRPPAKDWCEA